MPSLPYLYNQERALQRPNLSSTISASQESMSSHRNMEEKGRVEKKVALLQEVKEDGESKEVILVDLELGDKHAGDGSTSVPPMVELNLIGSFGTAEADQPVVTMESSLELVSCVFPRKRKFYTSQALGGHQNMHKQERILAKHSAVHRHGEYVRDHAAGVEGVPYHFPLSVASLPLHGLYPGRLLGT